MYVVIIREKDGTLNVVGPFWHPNAAEEFRAALAKDTPSEIAGVTDREKFAHND